MRFLIKMLMRNQFNILHLDRKKLLDYLKKKFSKLSLPKTFRVTHGWIFNSGFVDKIKNLGIIIHKIFFQNCELLTYPTTYVVLRERDFHDETSRGHMAKCKGIINIYVNS